MPDNHTFCPDSCIIFSNIKVDLSSTKATACLGFSWTEYISLNKQISKKLHYFFRTTSHWLFCMNVEFISTYCFLFSVTMNECVFNMESIYRS